MSNPNDERLRYARKLATAGLVVRVIGVAVIIGSVIGVMVALNLRRPDDRIGFSLISMAVLLFGALVWGSGMFHSAVARFLPSVVDIEDKLDALARPKKPRGALRATGQGGEATSDAHALSAPAGSSLLPAVAMATSEAGQKEPLPNAFLGEPSSTIPEPWTAEAASRVQAIAITSGDLLGSAEVDGELATREPSVAGDGDENPMHARAVASDLDPERVPCPHCGGGIHPEASRCVHCMRRVERPAALPS
jgi:hypothetical protein